MTNFENIPDVLTVSELQQVLRIGRSTAYRLIKANEIQSLRIGRSIRVPKSSVIDYVKTTCLSLEARREMCYDEINVTTQDRGLSGERSVT